MACKFVTDAIAYL